MSELPEPLTPPDCDLRGFDFMPLDTIRLLDSDLFALSTGEEFKAALALWCKSWAQVPAASLPSDDRVLAFLSGTGVRWKKVREIALRGWIKCSDGRLYHHVVAEKALEAFDRRGEWSEKQDTKNERQKRWRERQKRLSEQLRTAGITPPKGASLEVLERLLRDAGVDIDVDATPSTRVSTVGAGEMPKTGTGTGTGTIPPNPHLPPVDIGSTDLAKVMQAGGMITQPPDHGLIREWLALPNMQLERDVIPVVTRVAKEVLERTGRAPFKLKLFDAAIRDRHTADEGEITRLRRVRETIERQDRQQRDEREARDREDGRWRDERSAVQ